MTPQYHDQKHVEYVYKHGLLIGRIVKVTAMYETKNSQTWSLNFERRASRKFKAKYHCAVRKISDNALPYKYVKEYLIKLPEPVRVHGNNHEKTNRFFKTLGFAKRVAKQLEVPDASGFPDENWFYSQDARDLMNPDTPLSRKLETERQADGRR